VVDFSALHGMQQQLLLSLMQVSVMKLTMSCCGPRGLSTDHGDDWGTDE